MLLFRYQIEGRKIKTLLSKIKSENLKSKLIVTNTLNFNIMIFKTCEVILNSSKSLIFRFNSNFVPKHTPVQTSDAITLERFIKEHNKILVLTGIVYHKWLI